MSFEKRIAKLQKALNADALIVDDTTNLYYLTGLDLSAGKLVVTPGSAHLVVDGRYFEACRKNSLLPVILADQANQSFKKLLLNNLKIKNLAFSSDTTSYKSFQELSTLLPELKLIPTENPIKKLRMLKDPEEIKLLKTAADLNVKGYEYVKTLLKEGISEIDLASELEIFWKKHRSKSLSFDPIIAFGPNSAMPHYRAGKSVLKQGVPVLIDIGVNCNHYNSDMTRVVFFGKVDPEIEKIYQIVEKAQKEALKLCKPGTLISKLDSAARDLISDAGYGDKYTHNLGHGVGLEIHESPFLRNSEPFKNMALEAGMVITIEPGIYLQGLGGVRIEDTVLITDDGYENLTRK